MQRMLPSNIEAECAALGCILIDPEAIVNVIDFLRPEDFYRDAHRLIYEATLTIYRQHQPADFITLTDELERRNQLEDVGGAGYITSLLNTVPTSANVVYYARIVERTGVLRRLIHASGNIAAMAYEASEENADMTLEQAEALLFAVRQSHLLGQSKSPLIRDALAAFMGRLDQLSQRRGTLSGVPTGFTDLDRLLGGLQRSDLVILAARPAVGKCIAARTLIDDPTTGERLTIEECVQRRLPLIYSLSEEGQMRPTSVTNWINSGIQPCYQVRTRLGRTVEATGHHPFLTVNGWVPLQDLSVGYSIAIPTAVSIFGQDESWPLDLVRLLAYFIAAGSLTDWSPEFTNTDPVIVEDFKQIVTKHFPDCAARREGATYILARPKRTLTYDGGVFLKDPAVTWLKELGLMGKLSKDNYIPKCVWTWSRTHLAEFLRVIMSCDGSIYQLAGIPCLEISLASQQLAADVQHAFTRFGIISKLSEKFATYQEKRFKAWRVEVTHPESVKKYQDEIGWIGEKSKRFSEYVHKFSLRGSTNGHSPKETWQLVRNLTKQQELSLIELARKAEATTQKGHRAGYNAHVDRNIPRRRLAAYAETLNSTQVRRIASSDVYWDEIVAIEYVGEQHVYDLTVPDGSNFVAQDVYVHNSACALSIAHNAAVRHRQRIGIFSLEMSQEQMVQRLVSMDARIDQQRLRTGWVEDDDWECIIQAIGTLSDAAILIDDTAGITPLQLRSKARQWVVEYGELDLIIVDYLQLMRIENADGKRSDNRVQIVDEIASELKALARELNIPVLALAQLSRAVEQRHSKVPQLSDLRECVVGDTRLVNATTGQWMKISNVREGMRILGVDDHQRIRPFGVERMWSTGVKTTYLLTTRTGRQIQATANHPFLTPQGWKCLGQLHVGDVVATALRLPEHGAELEERAEKCRLLGYLVGDGTYHQHQEVGFISMDEATMQDVCEIVSRHFPGVLARDKLCHNSEAKQIAFSAIYANGFGNPLREWLRSLDMFGQRDNTKHVPDYVFEAGVIGAKEFLAGYLATDGCVKQHRSESHKRMWEIHFDTVSHRLALDVQALLLRLGIVSSVQPSKYNLKSIQSIYRVVVALTAENLRQCTQIPVHGKKGELLLNMEAMLPRGRTDGDMFGLPEEVSMIVAERSRRQAKVPQGGWTGRTWRDQGKRMRREVCLEWALEMEDPELSDWATSDLLWEPIRSIASAGEAEVFDITIPGCANFLGNGIVAHNSGGLEQTADVVMFIYRDDVYNPETERRNQADIIVAKHRNGPVGEVVLYFERSQTRFRDLEVSPPSYSEAAVVDVAREDDEDDGL